MESKKTDPSGDMNSTGMRVVALFDDQIRNIVSNDNPVKNDRRNENRNTRRKVIEEHNPLGFTLIIYVDFIHDPLTFGSLFRA